MYDTSKNKKLFWLSHVFHVYRPADHPIEAQQSRVTCCSRYGPAATGACVHTQDPSRGGNLMLSPLCLRPCWDAASLHGTVPQNLRWGRPLLTPPIFLTTVIEFKAKY